MSDITLLDDMNGKYRRRFSVEIDLEGWSDEQIKEQLFKIRQGEIWALSDGMANIIERK